VLRRLAAMRSYMRDINLGRDTDESIAEAVGMTGEDLYEMYRLLAIAKYEHRYVIPAAHQEAASALEEAPGCSLDFEGGPGMGQATPVGEVRPVPVSIESFHLTKQRALAAEHAELPEAGGDRA
jgi:nitrate reductase beta subunit